MKRLFLTSQVKYVAHDIAAKLGREVKKPAVFITTTIHDKLHSNLSWHETNRTNLSKAGFLLEDYDISGKSAGQIKSDLAKYEIMYIEGGNSFYLLQKSQHNNFGSYVKERVGEGMIYLSTSAGSVIAGPSIEPVSRIEQTSLAPDLVSTDGYGLVDFVVMPHWGSEEKRKFFEDFRIKHIYNIDYPYILLNDHQYVEVTDELYKIVDVTKE